MSKEETKPKKRKIKTPQTVRGMRDILPEDELYWRKCYDTAQTLADQFGFSRIETPVVEHEELFVRTAGKTSDIVQKEMYNFLDKDEKTKLVLRPEFTASLCRAYITNGMFNRPQPQKLWSYGPAFRHDRPQHGRYRQFYQVDFEILGSAAPVMDAQIILMTHLFFKELGINAKVLINSIGSADDRTRYKMELIQWYRPRKKELCENCQKRLVRSPLRLLDCKEESCQEVRTEAPQILDFLGKESKKHFMAVLEYLDELEIPYHLDPYIVRGLDYYNDTVFEFVAVDAEEKAQMALCGGGRYNPLVQLLGGKETPGVGVAPGIDRAILTMKAQNVTVKPPKRPQIFVAQLGELGRRRALALFNTLREAKFTAVEAFGKKSLKAQLDIANELGIQIVLLVGQKEVLDGTVIIRDMDAGNQETVRFDAIVPEVKKKLKSMKSKK